MSYHAELLAHYKQVKRKLAYIPPPAPPPEPVMVLPPVRDNVVPLVPVCEGVDWRTVYGPFITSKQMVQCTLKGVSKRRHVKHYDMAQCIMGNSRLKAVVFARHEFWYVLATYGWSQPRMALVGDWDHTSVMHGIRCHSIRNSLPMPGKFSFAGESKYGPPALRVRRYSKRAFAK